MKAIDFVNEAGEYYQKEENRESAMQYFFDKLIHGMTRILADRSHTDRNSIDTKAGFLIEYGSCRSLFEKHLGSLLKETNQKAEKINKLGKYGFPENWFQHMFIKLVKDYCANPYSNSGKAWGYYFPDCTETDEVSYPAFNAVKEFLFP
jgi:hypothetical protein